MSGREMVVSVKARYPLSKVVESYADAITPDGGYLGTINQWIEEYALGFISEMSPEGCAIESDWKLTESEATDG